MNIFNRILLFLCLLACSYPVIGNTINDKFIVVIDPGHGGADYTTATGTFVRVGTVAVDKSVIPLGTRMYIVSNDGSVVYGLAVAEDTGVRGNIVDLYYETYQECINFGRRGCTVYILE